MKRTTPYWEKIARTMVNVMIREQAAKAARSEKAKAKALAKAAETHELFGLDKRARVRGITA